MAVEAQYPSNILLLDRNGQEDNNYPLQPQATEAFLDQSHILFLNTEFSTAAGTTSINNNNTRKRGREEALWGAATAPGPPFHHLSSSMQSQVIELSKLHSNLHPHQQNVAVSTGLRLSFGLDHHQHLQNQHAVSVHDLNTQIKRQSDEIDCLLQAQGEELRRTLAEKRQRHYRTLISAAEESIFRKLREKEEEFEKATRRNAELEARAAQIGVEVQLWQAKAKAQEAIAASLQAQLQRVINGGHGGGATADDRRGFDGLGCCSGGVERQAEDAESGYVDPDRVVESRGPSCKRCGKRAATVVVLPCRHLCMCTQCDEVADLCPLCLRVRNSSVEVFPY